MASRPLIIASVCLLTALSPAVASNTPDKFGGLLANSPFGSLRTGAPGSGAAEPLEFRAVLEENGNRIFSIYDTATHQANWVDLNDPVKEFSVKEYDAEHASVTVEYQGKTMTLALKRAPAVAQVAPQIPPPGPNGAVAPGNFAGGPGGPTAVDQQRIQQIQEEIRRRRALRSQPSVPGNPSGTPPNYGNGPVPQPSTGGGPVPQPSNSAGPQMIPPKT